MNENLKGIIIDASKGGYDFGYVKDNIIEKNLNLDISNYLYTRFNELGIPVYMTRQEDETISQNERLNTIKKTFGDEEGVLVLINSLSEENNSNKEGAEIIYSVKNDDPTLANNILKKIEETGQINLATKTKKLSENTNSDYNYLLRKLISATPLIINYGNINNPNDRQKIIDKKYNYAEAVVEAITDYYNLPYEKPSELLSTYIVRKGDSLYSIAEDNNTTVGTIKALNNLKSNILSIGQIIKLPTYKGEKITENIVLYTVQPNDDLDSISKKFNITKNDLINYNQLFNTTPKPNNILDIPINLNEKQENITYIVTPGDTIYTISKKFNVPVDLIKDINNLENNMVTTNQSLIIPNTENYITYFVRTGDTLNSIANRYNTTIEDIKRINNLIGDDLPIAKLLIINKQ